MKFYLVQSAAAAKSYRIKFGDNSNRIVSKLGTMISNLKGLNGLSDDWIILERAEEYMKE